MKAFAAEPQELITVRLDRPFILSIRDRQTGTILFLGRVMNPAS
jgi:serine protease inhibitor